MENFESLANSSSRYFLEATQVCYYCRKTGHLFRNCQEKLSFCNICEQDHDPSTCSLADVCFKCFKRGHAKRDCPMKQGKYCMECRQHGHATMECEYAWRRYSYEKNDDGQDRDLDSFIVSCYNCGSSSHFGDYCTSSGQGYNKTAFSLKADAIANILRKVEQNRKRKGMGQLYKPKSTFVYSPGPNGSGGAMPKTVQDNGKRKREDIGDGSRKRRQSGPRSYASLEFSNSEKRISESPKLKKSASNFSPEERFERLLQKRERKKNVADLKTEKQQEKAKIRREEKELKKTVDSATVVFDERVGLVPAAGFKKVIKNLGKTSSPANSTGTPNFGSSDITSRLGSRVADFASTPPVNINFADTSVRKKFGSSPDSPNMTKNMRKKMKKKARKIEASRSGNQPESQHQRS